MSEQCRICGRDLKTGVAGWPQPLLPGDLPTAEELCSGCRDKVQAFTNPIDLVTVEDPDEVTIYPHWQVSGPGSFELPGVSPGYGKIQPQ